MSCFPRREHRWGAPEISVVIAAYNAEEWIEDCVRSVLGQRRSAAGADVPGYEVVVVDDGSSDATPALLASLAAESAAAGGASVRIVSQENSGVSSARNAGISAARGSYICFVDADDILHPEAFSIMWRLAGADTVVVPGESYGGVPSEIPAVGKIGKVLELSGEVAVEECLYRRKLNPDMHGALIPRKFFDANAMFRPGRYEDLDLFYRLYEKAKAVKVMSLKLYYYRAHRGSFINRYSRERLDALDVTQRIHEHYRGTRLESAAIDRQVSACFNMLRLIYRFESRVKAEDKARLEGAKKRIHSILRMHRWRVLMNPKGRLINKPVILMSYLGPGALKFLLKR